ncbi:MAG: type II CAAX prenyl endopeptidase Rce1 family protein [Gemmatimonadaceae bacterium]
MTLTAARAPAERRRLSPAVEAVGMLALVMIDIWLVDPYLHRSWIALVALAVATHVRRGESAAAIGFRRANLWPCLVAVTPLLLAIGALAVVLGARFGTVRRVTPAKLSLFIVYYCLWGLIQQYALNGYFVNRFAAGAAERGRGRRLVPLLGATCFALAHLPNWFLVSVTFAAGWLCAGFYLKYRNLYPLGLAHGLLGTALYFTVPDAISLHFHVGPGALRWQRLHGGSGATPAACVAPCDHAAPR